MMDYFSSRRVTVNFTINDDDDNDPTTKHISHPVDLPLSPNIDLRELTAIIIRQHSLPAARERSILKSLSEFIELETNKIYSDFVRSRMSRQCSATDLMSEWGVLMKESIRSSQAVLARTNTRDAVPTFASMYHSLIHSGTFTRSIIDLENSYAASVSGLIEFRDRALAELHARQNAQMEDLMSKLGKSKTEGDINELSAAHLSQSQELLSQSDRRISRLKENQTSEFREWIKKLYEDHERGLKGREGTSPPADLPVAAAAAAAATADMCHHQDQGIIRLEESFTINLGAQLKTSHNLRLIACDLLALCRIVNPSGKIILMPQRMQTAMSLYSQSLSALVLFVDKHIDSYSGISKSFASICNQTTELHFDNLDGQLEKCKDQHQSIIINGGQGGGQATGGTHQHGGGRTRCLNLGDFYVTRHSNLSQVHAVYHVASDDSVRSCELNSRHPVILGLRNVLKSAHSYDVKTLFIPLFLTNETTDDMTIEWCVRRAELVLKCVKGFLIESAALSTADETRTLNFLVPHDISDQLFSSLSHLLPTVFRMANPLVLKSSSSNISTP